MAWQAPSITVKWGPYFQPDPAEQAQIVTMAVAALNAGGITRRQLVEKFAPIFGTENIEAALKDLEDERAANDERELTKTKETAKVQAEFGAKSPTKPPFGK